MFQKTARAFLIVLIVMLLWTKNSYSESGSLIYWIECRYDSTTLEDDGRYIMEYNTSTKETREWECPFLDGFLVPCEGEEILLGHEIDSGIVLYTWKDGVLLDKIDEYAMDDAEAVFGYGNGLYCYSGHDMYVKRHEGRTPLLRLSYSEYGYEWQFSPSISTNDIIAYDSYRDTEYSGESCWAFYKDGTTYSFGLSSIPQLTDWTEILSTVIFSDEKAIGFIITDRLSDTLSKMYAAIFDFSDADNLIQQPEIIPMTAPFLVGGFTHTVGNPRFVGMYTSHLWYNEYYLDEVSIYDTHNNQVQIIKDYGYGPRPLDPRSAIITFQDDKGD